MLVVKHKLTTILLTFEDIITLVEKAKAAPDGTETILTTYINSEDMVIITYAGK